MSAVLSRSCSGKGSNDGNNGNGGNDGNGDSADNDDLDQSRVSSLSVLCCLAGTTWTSESCLLRKGGTAQTPRNEVECSRL